MQKVHENIHSFKGVVALFARWALQIVGNQKNPLAKRDTQEASHSEIPVACVREKGGRVGRGREGAREKCWEKSGGH